MNMIKKELLDFIESKGHVVNQEVDDEASRLIEVLEAGGSSDIEEALKWLERKREAYKVNVEEIPVRNVERWRIDEKTGNISHESGRFFSIIGVKVEGAEGREVASWSQPMIKQAECGILGILCQRKNGIMHYLFYAKYEPGTIASLQLSPTLQATESNLMQAHGGKKPLLAEYFESGGKGNILVNVVEVEDPGRFYHKTNRCMIVEIPENENVNAPQDYIWLNLCQVKRFLKIDNTVNALARCVLGSR